MTISDAGILEIELEKVKSLLTKSEYSLQKDGAIPNSSEIEIRINKQSNHRKLNALLNNFHI